MLLVSDFVLPLLSAAQEGCPPALQLYPQQGAWGPKWPLLNYTEQLRAAKYKWVWRVCAILSESFITCVMCLSPGNTHKSTAPSVKRGWYILQTVSGNFQCFFFLNALVYLANQKHDINTVANIREALRPNSAFKGLEKYFVLFQVFSLPVWRIKVATVLALMFFPWPLAICCGIETFPTGIHALANFSHCCHINSAFFVIFQSL